MKKIFFLLTIAVFFLASVVSAIDLLTPSNDAGFELDSPDGSFPSSGYWTSSWFPTESGAVVTTTAAYSGNNGLWAYTASTTSNAWTGIYQQFNAAAGDSFSAGAYIRAPSGQPWVSGSFACVRLEFLNSVNSVISSQDSNKLTTSNTGWANYNLAATAPSGTAKVRIRPYLEKPATGTAQQSVANFDDLTLTQTQGISKLYLNKYAIGINRDSTQEKFTIRNIGTGTLSYTLSESLAWLSLSQYTGSLNANEEINITATANKASCAQDTCSGTISLTTNDVNTQIKAYVETGSIAVPSQPSIVTAEGNKLVVRKRLLNGSLDKPLSYAMKGAAWTPASIGTAGDGTSRRNEFKKWYVADINLLKEMNVNTVYTFLDFYAIPDAYDILDYLYKNGIMAVMTVDDDGNNNLANIDSIVPYYKNHPAILMWAIGNEWNINYYHGKFSTLDASASATETASLRVKSYDTSHPVASVYGEIDIPANGQPLSKTGDIVNNVAKSVDVWGLNIYRGDTFGTVFSQWKSITNKSMFFSEYGTDSYYSTTSCGVYPIAGYEDESIQVPFEHKLWTEIKNNLTIYNDANVCLGGTVFESTDEWWKVQAADGGSINVHDNGGFYTCSWNPYAHPDGVANEEYFGIISIERKPKQVYSQLQTDFSTVSDIYLNVTSIPLNKGWNLMSLPLGPVDKTFSKAFGPILGNCTNAFTYYDGKWRELQNSSKVNESMGIYLNMRNANNLTLVGSPPVQAIALKSGWNLIGYPYLNKQNASTFFSGMGITRAFAYNNSNWSSYSPQKPNNLNILQFLTPGFGYWVKT